MELRSKIMVVVTIVAVFLLTPIANDFVWASPVPDTGQAKSFTKLDGNGNDLPEEAPSWVMVRENVTGLIWEVKTDDDGIHDKDTTYAWQDAQDVFITTLNSQNFGGHSDWRLPTVKEISFLVDCSIPFPPGPTINSDYFANTISSYYWSSTTYIHNPGLAWVVNFYSGSISMYTKANYLYYVRAVRGGQCGSFGDFIDNGDGTVTDTETGLMWQQDTAPSIYNGYEALSYCENLNLAGYNDWRLPNRNELQSIVDYSRYDPSIDPVFNSMSYVHWSSTIYANTPLFAWLVNFNDGGFFSNKQRTYYYYVRAVRGGECGSLGDVDEDCRIDCIDNCLSVPNGLYSGTCSKGTTTQSCTDDEQCGSNGFCSMQQEDIDRDGVGDACDECTDTDKDGYGNPGFLMNACSADNCSHHPNGSTLGTCVTTKGGMMVSYRVGDPKEYITCVSDADCTSTGGTCQMGQGDCNGNDVGDVCECYANFNYPTDLKVNASDLGIYKQEYGRIDCKTTPPACKADVNNDGKVNASDLGPFKNEYGRQDCPTIP